MVKSSQPAVPLLRAAMLERYGFEHAFTTRAGGISEGPLASLNLRMQPEERPDALAENRARLRATLGMGSSGYHELRQVHGTRTISLGLDPGFSAAKHGVDSLGAATQQTTPHVASPMPHSQALEGDALVAHAVARTWIAIATADCVPVLIGDRRRRHVAAVHAGWRGVVGGILPAAVRQLLGAAGAGGAGRAVDLCVAIGPHISVSHFEIGEEVAKALQRCGGPAAAEVRNGQRFGDLGLALRAQLVTLGIKPESIEDLRRCTFAEEGVFFSHRRDRGATGRQLALIRSG